MTENASNPGPADPLPAPVVAKPRGLPVIWIIPIVAIAVGGWLWYRAVQEQGPKITIFFDTAAGLEAGKTKIKFKQLEVGKVTTIDLADDGAKVVVRAEMMVGAEPYMVDSTRFWVVLPRVGSGGISGLGTLVSGAYINVDLGENGSDKTEFVGLEDPPVRSGREEGTTIVLSADALNSHGPGTPVYHMQVEVGQIERYEMLRDPERIEFRVFIEDQYSDLLRENSRFWNTSGVRMNLNAQGFEVEVESLQSLLSGGLAFGIPQGEMAGAPVTDGARFELYESRGAAAKNLNEGKLTILYFDEPVHGLKPGAAVDFRGIEMGTVLDVRMEFDLTTAEIRTPVLVETYPGRLESLGRTVGEAHEDTIRRLAGAGLRAQLGSPNLVTGARVVEVVYDPDSPAVFRAPPDVAYPELPTIPSTGVAIAKVLEDLPAIVTATKEALEGASRLVNSSDTERTLTSARTSTESLQRILADVEEHSDSLLTSAEVSLDDIRRLLSDVDDLVTQVKDSAPGLLSAVEEAAVAARETMEAGSEATPELLRRLNHALDGLVGALASVQVLAETLERQPESLLKGKGND